MAHYAFLDDNNIVTDVITGIEESETSTLPSEFSSWEEFYGTKRGQTCKRTSYNTFSNQHNLGGSPFRGNYAGIGFSYDEVNDVFLEPKPYPSWVIDESTWLWKAPVDKPDDDSEYVWNEDTTTWDIVI